MKPLEIGQMRIECSPFIALIAVYAVMFELTGEFFIMLVSLSIHELCHAMTARALGYDISSIEIQPFGFVARLKRPPDSVKDEALIASAGPLFSLIAGLAFTAVKAVSTAEPQLFYEFGRINLLIGAVNLAPAYPLDGGRVLHALLERKMPAKKAIKVLFSVSATIAVLLVCLGLSTAISKGFVNPTLFIMAVFLLISTIKSYKQYHVTPIDNTFKLIRMLRREQSVEVKAIAMLAQTPALAALRNANTGACTVIVVLDEELNIIGCIPFARLASIMVTKGIGMSLSDALKAD